MRNVLIVVISLALVAPCFAQRLQDRIDDLQRRRAAARADEGASIRQRLRTVIETVNLDNVTAREAFNWWSQTTGVPLVIDWEAMALDGIDPDQTITLHLQYVPASQMLSVLMHQAAGVADFLSSELIYERTPWYVRIMTKRQANRHPVTRVYDVRDLLMPIPNFDNAPAFDLNQALSNTSSGGGGGGGGSDIFSDDGQSDREPVPTKTELGEALAQLVRDSIEPDIWFANGGDVASVRYLDGRLIVRAPMYVQRQIGIPAFTPRRPVFGSLDAPPGSTPVRSGGGAVGGVHRSPDHVSGTR